MATRMTSGGKFALIGLAVGALIATKIFWWDKRPQDAKQSATIGKVQLPTEPEASLKGAATPLPLPEKGAAANGGTQMVQEVMAWNSQFALMYANGAATTAKGSLMDKANLNLEIRRQDDCMQSMADLVKFANDYKNDPTTPGVLVSYMGDGGPYFAETLRQKLEPLGPEYKAIGFYTMGKSYGEDKLMGPKEWRTNPRAALGKTICTVLRDGDMNIALKWCGDNNLKVNPDETTFDSLAVNFIAASDYKDAGTKYIAGYRESRKLIRDGKKVSETVEVGVDAVATWTPVDVTIAEQKGGLACIVSTKEYSSQMPNITITIKKWANDHRTDVENYIAALGQAGDQVRSFAEAKQFAGQVSAEVYGENNAAYWVKYYNGVPNATDAQGITLPLGGSMAFNLNDAANMFGLGNDRVDRYRSVYTTFGDIVSDLYPEYMPTYPAYTDFVDKSFLSTVMSNHPELLEGQSLHIEYAAEITEKVGDKSYADNKGGGKSSIQFQVGKAAIMPESFDALNDIFRNAMVAEDLKIGVFGHTDDTGDPASNQRLSEARAEAVATYLRDKGIAPERIETKGFGETDPAVPNTSEANRKKNRRVQIVTGK